MARKYIPYWAKIPEHYRERKPPRRTPKLSKPTQLPIVKAMEGVKGTFGLSAPVPSIQGRYKPPRAKRTPASGAKPKAAKAPAIAKGYVAKQLGKAPKSALATGRTALGLAGKALGPAIAAMTILPFAVSGYRRGRRERDLAMLIERRAKYITPEAMLAQIRRQEELAGREARLARADPEAYSALQRVLGMEYDVPKLAQGEFFVGAREEPQPIGEVQDVLAALLGPTE